jgi:hypothetical protein
MLEQTQPTQRPLQVLFIDHSFNQRIGWFEKFAKSVSGLQIILLTDKRPSHTVGALDVINVHDVAQNLELEELEAKLNFPIYRALITERAYFDYSAFTQYECYSRVNLDQIGKLVRPYANALDALIRTRADVVIGHLADNAIASLAVHIAKSYGVPYAAPEFYYWWPDGILFVDRPDQTSSEVDRLYRQYYADQSLIDRAAVDKTYCEKRVTYHYSDNITYSIRTRIKKIITGQGHDPFSPVNWLTRRYFHLMSQIMTPWFTHVLPEVPPGKRYVLFPLHVMPEASLLGTVPELADQFSLIKNISMNLPWGVRLCVKQHPEQDKWSGPGFDFFRKLGALKNADVIDAKAPLDRILRDRNCIAVASINSTVGLDAAFQRKPVFVFGAAVYGVADCFLKPRSFEEFNSSMLAIAKGQFQFDDGALLSILAALDAAVTRGNRPFWDANTLEEAALGSFSAFEHYIRSEKWRKPAATDRIVSEEKQAI